MKKNSIENHKETFYQEKYEELFQELKANVRKSTYVPELHISPEAGLMNDPNGLSYFNGKYHVFFQWYPFGATHGLKHWGHTTSENLVQWSKQEFALIPDQEYEKNGCYSGNAFEYKGELYLFYTANYKTEHGKIPKQAVAVMNKAGEIKKFPEPIISEGIEGLSGELRDPFVFEREGTFYMLLGGGMFEGAARSGFGDKGVIVLYQSSDLFDWEYVGLLDLPIPTGYMLECPSVVQIDGKDVLFLSPMGYEAEEKRFHNRFATIYLVGHLDLEHLRFEVEHWDEMDAGFDFYAPQAFMGKNEPLLFGWFGCGEQEQPIQENWQHGLTFPQKMWLEDNRLKRYPVSEIIEQFTEKKEMNTQEVRIDQAVYRLQLTTQTSIKVGKPDDYWELLFRPQGEVTISREHLAKTIDESYGMTRSTTISTFDCVDIFVDHSFIEIYINNGERVFSFNVYQEKEATIWSNDGILEGTLYF